MSGMMIFVWAAAASLLGLFLLRRRGRKSTQTPDSAR
jgi:MYXO-CTERM domain-containing protein